MTRSGASELLERLSRIVPGVGGYQDRERRRAHDGDVRRQAAEKVAACRGALARLVAELSRGPGTLGMVGASDRVMTRLERLEDELRYAAYGYAGWFDRAGVALQDLERLYQYDLSLLESAGGLMGLLPASPEGMTTGGLSDLEKAVDGLQGVCDGRRKALEGEGK